MHSNGCTQYKGLPITELNSLKQFLFSKLVMYWSAPHDFEPIWSRCIASIGHGCRVMFNTIFNLYVCYISLAMGAITGCTCVTLCPEAIIVLIH